MRRYRENLVSLWTTPPLGQSAAGKIEASAFLLRSIVIRGGRNSEAPGHLSRPTG